MEIKMDEIFLYDVDFCSPHDWSCLSRRLMNLFLSESIKNSMELSVFRRWNWLFCNKASWTDEWWSFCGNIFKLCFFRSVRKIGYFAVVSAGVYLKTAVCWVKNFVYWLKILSTRSLCLTNLKIFCPDRSRIENVEEIIPVKNSRL